MTEETSQILGFGYFPRHKYHDLVFYVKYVGDQWNHSLIEVEDTRENREIVELLQTARPLKKEGPAAPAKEQGTTTGAGGYLDKEAVLKALHKVDYDVSCKEDRNDLIGRIQQQDQELKDLGKALKATRENEYKKVFEIIRPQVLYFAMCMEKKLRMHDKERGSRGWVGYIYEEELDFLYKRLKEEVKELGQQIGSVDNYIPNPDFTEADDVGNFAMMIRTSDLNDDRAKQCITELIESLHPTTLKKEPPKDEPELWICPKSGSNESCLDCAHAKPHTYTENCDFSGPNCAKCTPYKKEPTVTQEPAPVPKTDMEYLSARMMELEQHQGRDRGDLMTEIRGLIKSGGALADRVDALETRVRRLDNVFCNCPANKFPDFDRRIKECEERTMAYPARNTWQLDLEKHDRDIGALTLRLDNAESAIQKIQENKA